MQLQVFIGVRKITGNKKDGQKYLYMLHAAKQAGDSRTMESTTGPGDNASTNKLCSRFLGKTFTLLNECSIPNQQLVYIQIYVSLTLSWIVRLICSMNSNTPLVFLAPCVNSKWCSSITGWLTNRDPTGRCQQLPHVKYLQHAGLLQTIHCCRCHGQYNHAGQNSDQWHTQVIIKPCVDR